MRKFGAVFRPKRYAVRAAVEAGCPDDEYTPAEIKRSVVGYGRAEKQQVQRMIMLLLGLQQAPTPFDASDALAAAICHLHSAPPAGLQAAADATGDLRPGARSTGPGASRQATATTTSRTADPASRGARRAAPIPRTWRQYRPPSTE